MKLDDEMLTTAIEAWNAAAHPTACSAAVAAVFLAGYRMGLERAAKVCEEFAGARTNGHQCAAAIREMAHD